MIQVASDNPRDLLNEYFGIGREYDTSQVREFWFEHSLVPGGRIPLTEYDFWALRDIFGAMERNDLYARTLEYMKCGPHNSWGRQEAELIENKLVPAGLLEYERAEHSDKICRLTEMAMKGTYGAMVDESKRGYWR